MNPIHRTFGLALLSGLLLTAGSACEKKENPKPAGPPKPPAPDVTPKAGGGGGGSSEGSTVSKSPTTQPGPTTAQVAISKSPDLPDMPSAPPKDAASPERSKEAQDLVAGAIVAIKENRLDEARASLDKVDGMGEAVQKTIREQAKTVRANLDNVAQLQKTDLPLPTDGDNK